jgi:flagellar biosynthetic protein FliS
MQKAAHAYLQTQVTTTGQGDVVVLLYDGAVKFLNQAKERLASHDMAGKGLSISKALDIISELDGSLNLEKGGDIARNLHGLYGFCQNHLVKANINKSAGMIDEVIHVLSGLRSAYSEILSQPEAQAAAREAAANLGNKAISVARKQLCLSVPSAPESHPGVGARMRASYGRAASEFSLQEPDA